MSGEATEHLIEVDGEVWDAMKAEAEPFVDSPNSVLRRKFGLDVAPASTRGSDPENTGRRRAPLRGRGSSSSNGKPTRPKRAPRGSLLAEQAYELPILQAIHHHGGRAPAREVIEEVGAAVRDQLTQLDLEEIATGGLRWQKRVQFTRLRLVERGLVKKDSPRGVWEITDDGRRALTAGSTAI